MKIIYPGPKVEGEARTSAQYFCALGVELKPGENEVTEALGQRLVALGVAVEPPSGETVEAPEAPFLRSRRRRSSSEEEG